MIGFIASGGLLLVWAFGWLGGRAYERHRIRKAKRELEVSEAYRRQLAAWWESLPLEKRAEVPYPPKRPAELPAIDRKQLGQGGPYR